ncbi:spermidine synthase [Caulobacter sp. SLTY]|uniref:fused MFS/spermidine synthase n=1 Tax=Caulobacter sp. SLTY TaxID=2683262 RepID=UPI0014126310|nr:fused MFS/spermidine synthase [Caulobacter sp. SLTY]NBB16198.1 spermidine synthase [Caulobacter sp. SLTY]
MTAADAVPLPAETGDPTANERIPWIYVLAVFCGAAMVFMVQPMVAKLVLPQLGGSPQVWNTSMAFFQGALLVGYGYAHFLQKIPRARTQILIHLGVMAVAALALPLRITPIFGDPGATPPALWLLGVLAVSIGAPFAALSATAPLVQAWHAKVHGRHGGPEPWALYAASNLGSLLALLAYPAIFEPGLLLHDQRWGWSGLYVAFVGLMVVLAINIRKHDTAPIEAPSDDRPEAALVSWRQRLIWIALAALPSSLMLGVTAHLTTDVASAPFLWVLPLSLYLLTFIIAFQSRPLIPPQTALVIMSTVLIVTVATMPFGSPNVLVTLAIHLGAFFFCALVCHQALVARRPDPSRLTDFYLCMSIGGVVGGAFNAFVAPVIFETVAEYIIVLCLIALVRPWGSPMPKLRDLLVLMVAVVGFVLALHSVTGDLWAALDKNRFSALQAMGVVGGLGLFIVGVVAAIAFARRRATEPPRRMEWVGLAVAAVVWVLALAATIMPGLRLLDGIALIDLILALVLVSALALGAVIVLFRARPDLAVQPNGFEWTVFALALIGFDLAVLTLCGQFGTALIEPVDIVRIMGATGVLLIAVAAVTLRDRAIPFFICICLLAYAADTVDQDTKYYESRRSFFGVVHLSNPEVANFGKTGKELGQAGNVRVFSHGTTLHGAQSLDPMYECRPLTYYAPDTAIGQVFRTVQSAKPGITIGAVGLGTGAVAAYVRPTDRMTFFEIDPQVVAVSSNPQIFSYTSRCAKGPINYVVGDARLTLEKEPAEKFDILLIDAFSSDAIPAHLLTVEALKGYLARVKPDGIVILHLSNRHLELIFPAASVVKAAGGYAMFQGYQASDDGPSYWESSEDVMIVARNRAALAPYQANTAWLPAPPAKVRPWTDDYTNLIGAMLASVRFGDNPGRRWAWQTEAEVMRASPTKPPPAPPAPPAGR